MSIKILLADDSITIQKVVGIIFGGEEYSLTVVDNGKAAIEKARELNPDVLLIDALMPGMSGYEVCEAVRATPAIASKPILLLTGSFEPFDENKAKNCGADDFLAKPFESQQIVAKVRELIELAASRSEAPASFEPAPEPETFVASLVPEVSEANDIWGAFTTAEEPAPVAESTLEVPDQAEETVAFDFASSDLEPEFASPAEEVAPAKEEGTGSQWIPIEEETFEFEEQTAAVQQVPTIEESMFGDTDFEVSAPTPVVPEVEQAPVSEPVIEQIAAPAVVTPVTTAPLALTEEQLREALAAASKDVIERIVWEVVPDLAEVLIKEAIRKIKEGQ
jgi:CheY-like chemotaxis protein